MIRRDKGRIRLNPFFTQRNWISQLAESALSDSYYHHKGISIKLRTDYMLLNELSAHIISFNNSYWIYLATAEQKVLFHFLSNLHYALLLKGIMCEINLFHGWRDVVIKFEFLIQDKNNHYKTLHYFIDVVLNSYWLLIIWIR